jgi:hypothetical protein
MTSWMAWSVLVCTLFAVAGLAAERIAAVFGVARRGVWIAALAVSSLSTGAMALRSTPANSVSSGPTPVSSTLLIGRSDGSGISPRARGVDIYALGDRMDSWAAPTWAALAFTCLLTLGVGAARLSRRRASWPEAMTEVGPVLVSREDGPAVIGFLNPRIVMPVWALSADASTRRMMLRHELEHLRAGDSRLLVAAALLVALVPWNLALMFMVRRLRLAIEIDCDARVIRSLGAAREYAVMLLAAGERYTAPLTASALLFERGAQLELRIDAMTTPSPKRPIVSTVSFAAIAVLVLATAAWTPRPAPFRSVTTSAPLQPSVVMSPLEFPVPEVPHTAPRTIDRPRSARLRAVTPREPLGRTPRVVGPQPMLPLPAPRYPEDMKTAGLEGVVVFTFNTDEHGVPDTLSMVLVQATHESFAAAVRAILPRWRYTGAGVVQFACRFNFSPSDERRSAPNHAPAFAPGIDTAQQVVVTSAMAPRLRPPS